MYALTQHTTIIQKAFVILGMFVCMFLSTAPLVNAQSTQTPSAGTSVQDNHDSTPERNETVIPSDLEGLIYNIATGVGGFFVWVGGGLLDYAVEETVIKMGEYLSGGIGVAIDTTWTLVRDLFNILFIFGLIYIGFQTILKSDDSGVKSTLVWLIVAALMINFSLFITKAIVETSNLMSYQVYKQLIDEELYVSGNTLSGSVTTYATADGARGARSISYRFMNYLNLTTYAQTGVIHESQEGTILGGRIMFYGLLMMFFMLIAAFVFAAGAFILIARFVALIFFMILSPAMFLGWVFPMFAGYQKQWWDRFLRYAFVGPAYLFMLYLSVWVIAALAQNNSFAEAFSAKSFGDGAFIMFLNFFIIAGFLIGSLLVAQKMGVYGASGAVNILNKTRGRMVNYGKRAAYGAARAPVNVAASAGARGLRATAGRAGYNLAKGNGKWGSAVQKTKTERGFKGWAARRADSAAQGASKASYDVRRTTLGKNLGLNEGKKGGYDGDVKARLKEEKDFMSSIGPDASIYADYGVGAQHTTYKEAVGRRAKIFTAITHEKDQAKRTALATEMLTLDENLKSMRNGNLPSTSIFNMAFEDFAASDRHEEFTGSKEEFENAKKEAQKKWATFKKAQGDEKNYGKEKYVQKFGEGLTTASKVYDDSTARKAIVEGLRKEIGKKDNEKLIEAVKGIKT